MQIMEGDLIRTIRDNYRAPRALPHRRRPGPPRARRHAGGDLAGGRHCHRRPEVRGLRRTRVRPDARSADVAAGSRRALRRLTTPLMSFITFDTRSPSHPCTRSFDRSPSLALAGALTQGVWAQAPAPQGAAAPAAARHARQAKPAGHRGLGPGPRRRDAGRHQQRTALRRDRPLRRQEPRPVGVRRRTSPRRAGRSPTAS